MARGRRAIAWPAAAFLLAAANALGQDLPAREPPGVEDAAHAALHEARRQSDRLIACRALIARDPLQAYDYAREWADAAAAGGLQAALPAHRCAARALAAAGHSRDAAALFEEVATALSDRSPGAAMGEWRNAGRSWAVAGDHERAARALDAAVEASGLRAAQGGDQAEIMIDRAAVRGLLGNWALALEDADRGVSLSSGDRRINRDALLMRARVYRNLRVINLAEDDIAELLRRDSHDADARLERGLLRRQMGDEVAAGADFAAVLEFAPATPAGRLARLNLQAARRPSP